MYIAIDLACSLIAELSAELGVGIVRNARISEAVSEQLVQLCVLLRLLAAGGDGEKGLPLSDLEALLEELWLGSTQTPDSESR